MYWKILNFMVRMAKENMNGNFSSKIITVTALLNLVLIIVTLYNEGDSAGRK